MSVNFSIILPNVKYLPINSGHWPIHCIGLYLNRIVKDFGLIRRQDTQNRRLLSCFFPIAFVQGQGLNRKCSWKSNHFRIQPSPETASHNQGGSTHWHSFNSIQLYGLLSTSRKISVLPLTTKSIHLHLKKSSSHERCDVPL